MKALPVLQSHWTTAAKFVAWIGAIVATFLTRPPVLWAWSTSAPDGHLWLWFAQFATILLFGLLFLWTRTELPDTTYRTIAIAGLVVGSTLFFLYEAELADWTCPYVQKTNVIIGGRYGPEFAAYHKANPKENCADELADATGNNDKIWIRGDIVLRYIVIVVTYTLAYVSLSVTALSGLEFAERRRGSRPPPHHYPGVAPPAQP